MIHRNSKSWPFIDIRNQSLKSRTINKGELDWWVNMFPQDVYSLKYFKNENSGFVKLKFRISRLLMNSKNEKILNFKNEEI